mgnify:CR=1 FL=1
MRRTFSSIAIFTFFLTLVLIPGQALANYESESTNGINHIPQEVLEIVEKKEKENQASLPPNKAWEVDLQGNRIEVTPLGQRSGVTFTKYGAQAREIRKSSFTNTQLERASEANDYEYIYILKDFLPNHVNYNWYYKSTGTIRIENRLSTPAEAHYTQQNTTTTNWTVSGTLEISAEAGVKFLSKISGSLSVSAARSKTWYSGTSYGVKQNIPPRTTAYITNYAVGGSSNGSLQWEKYAKVTDQTYVFTGYYYESVGGTAVLPDHANVVISATEPV